MKSDHDTSRLFEELYHMLLDSIPSSVLMVGKDMRIVTANKNFLKKSRRFLGNTEGCRLEDVFPDIILEQMNIVGQIKMVFQTGKPTVGQKMSYRTPGVPLRIYYYRILPFSRKGIVESVILLMDDLTEQVRLSEEVRKVERHLASVFESASDIMLSTDNNGRILSWNPAAENVSGFIFNEVRGHLFFEYLREQHREEARQVFSGMREVETGLMAEWGLINKKEGIVQVSWVCSPIKDEGSRTIGMVAVGRDLTELRKLETQLIQSQKFAALGVMAGGIAHEIRNPLAISSSAAQFMMEDGISADFRKECADKINAGIKRASTIIENLLRFARPSAKNQSASLDITSLIRETILLISNQAKIQKVCIKTEYPDRPVFVLGNSSLLQQVFINLCLNSINAMLKGGTLAVSIESDGGLVLVRISDTGCGILKEDMNKIFDPFYTTAPAGKGTGLGLSICFSVVEQHSGTIEVGSKAGQGTFFIVRLPVVG
jgi:PAS domain S-box-containing protein